MTKKTIFGVALIAISAAPMTTGSWPTPTEQAKYPVFSELQKLPSWPSQVVS